jgi:hypothetical protein
MFAGLICIIIHYRFQVVLHHQPAPLHAIKSRMIKSLLAICILFPLMCVLKAAVLAEAPCERCKPVVAIYAGRGFHDEVTASLACLFFVMDYEVIVYAYDSSHILGYLLPVTNSRIANSISYYGRCVHRWIPIKSRVRLVPNVTALVMVSYPMKVYEDTPDVIAYGLIRQMLDSSSKGKLLLVAHRASPNYWSDLAKAAPYVPSLRTAFVFLAEHLHHAVLSFRAENGSDFHTAHIHPTVPLNLLFHRDKKSELTTAPANVTVAVMHRFAVQGHFGGQHAKRRNVRAVVVCLNSLSAGANGSVEVAKLSLVGSGTAEVGRMHHRVRVTRHRDLKPLDFHRAVAQSTYLLTATGTNDAYESVQATSTVPLALTLQLPLVGKRSLLGRYPCLRDSEVLMALTAETDCDAIQQAVLRSAEQYVAARQAMAACGAQLWRQSIENLQMLLESMDGEQKGHSA